MTVPVLATVRLASTSADPADDAVNDFVFEMATFDSSDADDIATALASFYNTVQTIPGTDFSVANILSEMLSRASNAVVVDLYDLTGHLDGSPHGSPTFTRNFTLGAVHSGDVINMPAEVAVKVSAHGDLTGVPETQVNPDPPPATIRPAGRRRGGFYVGPLNTYAQEGLPVRVSDAFVAVLCAAAATLSSALDDGWSIWSRTDAQLYPIVGGWVDSAFDTIHNRGEAPAARTLWVNA